ncbi:MAG: hypothetical protein L6R40_005197 [Gallowayella cf. fulva]|nr:MAG: hypothetical protein L6R40_005197 [Xanthomendoza cf. fulva]
MVYQTLTNNLMKQDELGYRARAHPSYSQSSLRRKADLTPLPVQQSNGNTRPPSDPSQREIGDKLSRNGTPSSTKAPSNMDSSYLSPPRRRPALSDKSRSGSEADSLLDLYGHPRSVAEGTEKGERDVTLEDLYNLEQEDPESSRWIHRDKLAVIESHEMQEAGIKLPRQMRSKSSLRHKKSHSRNQSTASVKSLEPEIPAATGAREGKRQKLQPPPQQPVHDDPMEFDLRTSEERASDYPSENGPSTMYYQPNLGRSGSKIPLPKTSPLPIAQGHIERSTPLPRTRGTSGNWSGGDGEGLLYSKIRSRSNSIGSRVLLDDSEVNGTPTPTQRPASRGGPSPAPPKQHLVGRTGSVSNTRPRTSNGPRNISEPHKLRSSPTTQRSSPAFPRPKSRNGIDPPRPGTAVNRPEGEAPWIAEMYKPDPRLPPEEQMLPTHAKRLQQEQREREMKAAGLSPQQPRPGDRTPERQNSRARTPSSVTPDNQINPHELEFPSIHTPRSHQDPPRPENPSPNRASSANSPSSGQWPLRVAPPIKPAPSKTSMNNSPNNNNISPTIISTPDQPHGGYSTIPKVQSTPPIGSASSPKTMPQPMVQEKPKVKEKEPGCCRGCVVM